MKTHTLSAVLVLFALTISACGSSDSSGGPPAYGNAGSSSSQATAVPTMEPTSVPAAEPTSAPVTEPTVAPVSGTAKIQISNFAFSPASLTVKVGTTVTWTNEDEAAHTVVANGGSFKSGNLGAGGTFSFTFNTPGVFAYRCGIHASMTGTITVVQ